jgi:uncharacterized membrane protein
MSEQQDNDLARRVEQLEATTQGLQYVVKELSDTLGQIAPQTATGMRQPGEPASASRQTAISPEHVQLPLPPPPPPHAAQTVAVRMPSVDFDMVRSGEWWLNKIGIGLLLLGLGFLFKYAVDRGWLTEQVRIGFGLALGSVLLGLGLWLHKEHKHFSQVLLGGSIATYYITGYAAYELYHLVAYNIAFAFMVCVTLLAFLLTIRQAALVLSLIGAIGGLATPFLLYTDNKNIPALMGYTCLVLAGTSAIFFYKGWYSLLWISYVGGWWVFGLGLLGGIVGNGTSDYDRWALQGAGVFALLAFWALPLLRVWKILDLMNSAKRPRYISWSFLSTDDKTRHAPSINISVHALTVLTPLLTLVFSTQAWESLVSQKTWGWITIGGAIIYGLVALGLIRYSRPLAHTHLFVTSGLLAIALALLLENNALLLAYAIEGTAMLFISRRLLHESSWAVGHITFVGVGLWLAQRMLEGNSGATAVFNAKALTDLAVIALALVASFVVQSRQEALVYRLAAHVAFLGWLWRELSLLPDGKPYITIAWGAYALVLLIIGVAWNRNRLLLNGAIATLFLVVAKLILVDLTLDEVWRILLFLGFGGLFLVISYYFQVLMKGTPKSAEKAE